MLTNEQVEAYNTHGYVTVAGVLSPQEIEELRRVTEKFVDRSRQATDHTDEFDLEPGHTAEVPRLRRLKHPETLHPAYDAVMRNKTIVDMVAPTGGPQRASLRWQAQHESGRLR